jgi:hypothetical protein
VRLFTVRRATALADGPDLWEIIARLQELDGTEEQRDYAAKWSRP